MAIDRYGDSEAGRLDGQTGGAMGQGGAASVKLSDLVYIKMLSRIRGGDFGDNGKLPSEKELAEQIHVSRPVVREALARLRDEGMITSRRGSGSYVRAGTTVSEGASSPPLRSITDMRRCLEFRVAFEGETAFFAAQAAHYTEGRDGLVAAKEILDQGLVSETLPVDADFGFHLAVARATGNRFFEATMMFMRDSIVTGMGITPNFMPVSTRERLAMLHVEHDAIYDAIMANDPDAARAAMRQHLTNAMVRVFEDVD